MVSRFVSLVSSILVIAAMVTALPATVHAKASAAEEKFLEAVQAHKKGKLKVAIIALKAAAKSDPHPTLYFNVAVLADSAGDKKTAGSYYEKYLDTEPEDASFVLLRYRQISPKEAEAWAKAKEAVKAPGAGDKKDDSALAKKGDGTKKKKKGGDKPGGGSNLVTYSLLGAGGLALAVGAVFGALTVSDVNAFMDSRVRSEAERHADDAKSHQLMANISYLAGLAALGGGVAMLLMQDPGEGTSASVPRILPLAGPATAGGVLTLEF